MGELNTARVAFKHYGQLPSHADAVRFLNYADAFMRESVSVFYGADIDQLTLADLVRDEKLRIEIRNCEKSFADGNVDECIKQCAIIEKHSTKGLERILPKVSPSIAAGGDEFFSLVNHLTRHRSVLVAVMLGVPYGDYLKFRMLVPSVSEAPTGSVQFHESPFMLGVERTEDDARFCFSYITELILRSEQTLQPIDEIARERIKRMAGAGGPNNA